MSNTGVLTFAQNQPLSASPQGVQRLPGVLPVSGQTPPLQGQSPFPRRQAQGDALPLFLSLRPPLPFFFHPLRRLAFKLAESFGQGLELFAKLDEPSMRRHVLFSLLKLFGRGNPHAHGLAALSTGDDVVGASPCLFLAFDFEILLINGPSSHEPD